MAGEDRKLANGGARIDFAHRPDALPPLEARGRRRGRDAHPRRRREGRPVRGLRAQAQFLRSRRRHRARRRVRAAALRASGGARGAAALRQAARVLRRRQHPHAGGRDPRPQGQLLQVHQRDAQRHRGRERAFRPAHHLRDQRHRRRRRLRARARRRPHHAGRRRLGRGVAARGAAARRAARHRRAHPRHRQAQGAPRPRRRVLHHRGRREGQARRRLAAGRRDRAQHQARSGGRRRAPTRWRRQSKRPTDADGHRAAAARTQASRPTAAPTGICPVAFARGERLATLTLRGPDAPPPATVDEMVAQGAAFWPLRWRASSTTRSSTSASTSPTSPRWCSSRTATARRCSPTTTSSRSIATHWLAREITLKWKRVLKRIDLTSRTLVALVEPGSCFAGTLAELVFAADRSYMLIGEPDGDNRPPATLMLSASELRRLPDAQRPHPARHPLPRRGGAARPRLCGASASRSTPRRRKSSASSPSRSTTSTGRTRSASSSRSARASPPTRSPAWRRTCASAAPRRWNRRSSRRLTAWQNWIFQRPNAVGDDGALKRYGTGQKPVFDTKRV